MSDTAQDGETTPPATPDAPAANGDTPPAPAAGSGDSAPAGAPATFEDAVAALERANREAAETRREAANYRTRLRELEAAEEARRQEGMTETERMNAELTQLRERNAELEGSLRARDFADATATAARSLGFRNPALAAGLIDDAARRDLVGDDGNVDNAKLTAKLSAILKADPYLGSSGGGDGGAGRATQPGQNMNDRIRAAATGG